MDSEQIERRPAADGASPTTFPPEWGEPPANQAERRSWILAAILDGKERRAKGEHVNWLTERT